MVSAEKMRLWGGGAWGAIGRALLIVAIVVVAAPGCSKKKSTSGYDDAAGSGQGMNEGNVSGSSLDQFRRGTLGAGEQGPLQDVHFAYDSFELSDNAREILRTNADWLRENPKAKCEVEGHTDSRGTAEYNLALGQRRADAVKKYLVSKGIPANRLTAVSYGEEKPAHDNGTEEGRRLNRRAVLTVSLQR